MTKPIVVIGGGIGGLATAALLGRAGYSVTLLEQNDRLGGRAGLWETGGFRFDTGPSWYLMPEVFDHFFRLMGTSTADQLDLVKLDPGYRVFSESARPVLDIRADPAANRRLFDSLEAGAGAALDTYLAGAAQTYELAREHFLYATYATPRPFLNGTVLTHSARLLRLLGESLESYAARATRDPLLRQILGYPAVFLGTSPERAPSMYHLMSHLDLDDGVYYPRGGFTALVTRIAELATAVGVDIRTNATVETIHTVSAGRRSRVSHVDYRDLSGETQTVHASHVVSAVDRDYTHRYLLDVSPSRTRRVDPGPGAVLLMAGIRGDLPQLTHHNLFFTNDWRANFEKIFGRDRSIPNPASLYACKPSATDSGVAPEGHENLFVLVPVPADVRIGSGGEAGTGDPLVEATADAALKQIALWAEIPDLADRVVVRRTVGPNDFARNFNTLSGGALGPAHTLRQSAFFRAGNASRTVDGLLYAGCTTIPGIGLPMCLISAELVLKRLRGDTSGQPLPEPLRTDPPPSVNA